MSDEIFEALSDGYRRRLLVELLESNSQSVAFRSRGPEWDRTPDEASVRKHHVHLPKLADYGYIDWDRDRSVVTKGPEFDEIRPMLERLYENRSELPIDYA